MSYPDVNFSYQADLEIDENNLELEWMRQAKLMDKYSIVHSQAILDKNRAVDRLKDAEADLKKVYADLDGLARKTPAPPDLAKQADEAVKQWALRQPHYLQALKIVSDCRAAVANAEYVENVMFGAVMAFQARKTALENLVRLFMGKYYGEPYAPNRSEVVSKGIEEGRRAMTEGLKGTMPSPSPPIASPPPVSEAPPLHKWAVGPISDMPTFSHGPFSSVVQALVVVPLYDKAAIYRLTRNKPDEILYTWDGKQWAEVNPTGGQKAISAPPAKPGPRPPMRPIPKQ